ncbi:MAG: serine acetyltransferase, partial [Oscillospiraceae bacterium]
MGSILKGQISNLGCAVLAFFVGLRFKNLWQLKCYLNEYGTAKHGVLNRVYYYLTAKKGSFIGVKSNIAQMPVFPHDIHGVFISENSVIGKNCVIFQQVTIGSNTLKDSVKGGSPIVGDNVYIGAGAKIIGSITIGNNCRIGAGAVVVKDMPSNTVAVCAATRFIQKENLDNTFV